MTERCFFKTFVFLSEMLSEIEGSVDLLVHCRILGYSEEGDYLLDLINADE